MSRGEGETVLLGDDELLLLKVLSIALQHNGYRTLCTDGIGAIALYEEHAAEIKVVLTDIMMPGMDGVELTRALKTSDPQIKSIAVTGHASELHKAELR